MFEPTLEAAQARLAAVQPDAYARSRNALQGAVTRLSPYLTHGLLSLREVYGAVHARHPLAPQHKLVFELGWRAYYRHVWAHLGPGIHQSLHAGLLPDGAYSRCMPADVVQARTGIPVIDLAVHALYETGYVHNHARMWLASYLVHLRKVHWHTGADWMLGHLLDGDLASNHLSWQWVAGTGSSKPYLFNADNVAKFAPAPWHSPGTVIDTDYEALDGMARRATALKHNAVAPAADTALAEPALHATPPADLCPGEADPTLAAGRDVWLLHPWSLGADPAEVAAGALRIGVGLAECHQAMPWSERRWRFVMQGLGAQAEHVWWGNAAQVAAALEHARSVRWRPDPHADQALAQLQSHLQGTHAHSAVGPVAQTCLFEPVDRYCRSFSEWWKRTRIVP